MIYSLRIILHLLDVTVIAYLFKNGHYHFNSIEYFSLLVSPFECLGELIKQALDRGINSYKKKADKEDIYAYSLMQMLFYFALAVLFDYVYCNSFKGK